MLSRKGKTEQGTVSEAPFAVAQRDHDRRTSVISVQGELDVSTAPKLKWALQDSVQDGHSQLVVDLSLTSFMDSTALGVLIGVKRGLPAGAQMAIVCDAPSILYVFEVSGMDGAFSIYATLQDALATIPTSAAEVG